VHCSAVGKQKIKKENMKMGRKDEENRRGE
jgi:hypothetical protein